MDRLKEYYEKMVNQYPQFKADIDDYYQLALDEIEAGESPDNEYDIFVSEVESIIEDVKC